MVTTRGRLQERTPGREREVKTTESGKSGANKHEGNQKAARPATARVLSKPKQGDSDLVEKPSQPAASSLVEFEIPNGTSTFQCNSRPAGSSKSQSIMIYTHGAGGTISTPSVANFAEGFVSDQAGDTIPIICFQGNVNLKARTAQFLTVLNHHHQKSNTSPHPITAVFGGTSMGARAATMAANTLNADPQTPPSNKISKLVLASYPLQSPKGDIRDQILLEIDAAVEVLFVIGDRDNMCDLDRLDRVRARMKAPSWLLTVSGAGHGISCSSKKKAEETQVAVGRIAAEWVRGAAAVRDVGGDVGGEMSGVCAMVMKLPLHKKEVDAGAAGSSGSSKKKVTKARKEVEADVDVEAEAGGSSKSSKKRRRVN